MTDAVHRIIGLSHKDSSELVELFLKEITDCIVGGEMVKLASFGTFTVRKKRQRMGRNPKTGVEVPIAPRRVVVFRPSAIIKQKVDEKSPTSSVEIE